MKRHLALLPLVLAPMGAQEPARFVTRLKLPSGQTVLVAEGESEARSTGSFTVKLYEPAPPEDETTFFASGLVRSRDGVVEKALLEDLDGDAKPEVIVTVRSVGSGSYLSAHAFSIKKNHLVFRGCVESLPVDANPVEALRRHLRGRRGR